MTEAEKDRKIEELERQNFILNYALQIAIVQMDSSSNPEWAPLFKKKILDYGAAAYDNELDLK
jgi:hypothetical protein